jgi:hypothetical protein
MNDEVNLNKATRSAISEAQCLVQQAGVILVALLR